MISKLMKINVSRNKKQMINIIASVLNMGVTTLISFLLSPYIVSSIGVEANGFVNLANNFITCALLARTALNSMGSRFIMLAYYKNEYKKAQIYYSSLFFADLLLGLVLGVVGGICIWHLEKILVIPDQLIYDVKILFSLLFLNFIISTVITVWSTSPYIKNRLYLDSISSAVGSICRALVIFGLFTCLQPSICYIGIGTLFGGIILAILAYIYKSHLLPEMKANYKLFSWRAIIELISSGVWNSISSLGTLLLSNLDLLVANLFVGATAMGVLSVAKTMPSFISTLISTIAAVFAPSLIIDYAKADLNSIVKTLNVSSKILNVFCSIPLGFLLVYGKEFYALWQPSQNAEVLHILSVITILGRVFFTGIEPLFSIFTVVNKVKQNSIVTIVNGIISIVLTYFLVKYTDLGIYAIAGVSVVCCFFKNIFFVIPFSAKYLGLKRNAFYYMVFHSMLCCGILFAFGYFEKLFLTGGSWLNIILAIVVYVCFGGILTCLIALNKSERHYIFSIVLKRIKK